ncbi:MAG: DUF6046 domain-containing protein [Bacteroidales bacterium]|nr:DUF6046 domain-containing protein [Bacteroidales bacterium]MDD2205660.1 DUF6046 domain-containing protein [Bacteroidales bacterium]MDD3153044.1 DUF6046 domain-containing protein [Bacteroidales bacterium]MDD3915120.1 DUF6046 domain-containing protein [Bacteroidales bacterium]MDD4634894.1 DUF6046 domain-containing protein [Bacteroidales bacterium]
MSKITVYIPSGKNLHTTGMAYTKAAIYGAALHTDAVMFNYQTDKLRTRGFQYDNNLILRSSEGVEIELIDVKINVTHPNKIAETSLVGRDGTVKEFVQRQDYAVRIGGNLIGEKDKFPYDLLRTLLSILNKQESFEVASMYLELFGISKMVLKNADFNQNELKLFNVMPFLLTFVSDDDYDFLVEE